MDLLSLRMGARLSPQAAAELCGYNLRSWQRMERGRQRVPKSVLQLLILLGGDLGVIDSRWHGWSLHDGRLWQTGNTRTGYTWFEILQLGAQYALISQLERQIEGLLGTPSSNVIPIYRREIARVRAGLAK